MTMSSAINIKELDQSSWVCYKFESNAFYYGEVGYMDESGIVHPKDTPQAANNPKSKLVKHGFGVYLANVIQQGIPKTKYQGYWDKDQKSGKGSIKFADGTVYQGNFYEGHYHGGGKMIWPNGDQYEGNWKKSKMEGPGIFKHFNGYTLKGMFKANYFIDENILRNPFLNQKQYAVFKKERKQILKQKQKEEKIKHEFAIKIKLKQIDQLKAYIDNSTKNNRVPIVLSTKTVQYNLQNLVQSLQTSYQSSKIHIFDLRKLYTLEGEKKWNYRKEVHESFRNALAKGQIFILSLDESQIEFNEMFYPDVKQFYEPNGFNNLAWSREQLKQPEVRKRIVGQNGLIEQEFRLIVWTKFKVDESLNKESIQEEVQIRFEKIIPFVKIDCIVVSQQLE